jgi:cytochrome b561
MAMARRPRTMQFTATAKWLHWIVAFFMLSLLPIAIGFSYVAGPDRAEAIPVHASIGFVLLVLTLVRLGWRAAYPPPPPPETSPHLIRLAARVGHKMLYILILWQAVLGIWMAAASPVAIRLFNGFNLSALAPANPDVIAAIRPWHLAGAWALSFVIVAHIGGALWHHFKLKDDVLIRMLPFSGLWYRLTGADYAQAWRFPSSYLGKWPKKLSPEKEGL